MKIKITDANKAKLRNAIDAAENHCTARLFYGDTLASMVTRADVRLAKMEIPQKLRIGTVVWSWPPDVAKTYGSFGNKANGTVIKIKRFPSGWFLAEVKRTVCGECAYGAGRETEMVLTEDALNHYLARKNFQSQNI